MRGVALLPEHIVEDDGSVGNDAEGSVSRGGIDAPTAETLVGPGGEKGPQLMQLLLSLKFGIGAIMR